MPTPLRKAPRRHLRRSRRRSTSRRRLRRRGRCRRAREPPSGACSTTCCRAASGWCAAAAGNRTRVRTFRGEVVLGCRCHVQPDVLRLQQPACAVEDQLDDLPHLVNPYSFACRQCRFSVVERRECDERGHRRGLVSVETQHDSRAAPRRARRGAGPERADGRPGRTSGVCREVYPGIPCGRAALP